MEDKYFLDTITIRIQSHYIKSINNEAKKRMFFKKNGEVNIGAFINTVLYGMLIYRDYKKQSLRKYLSKNIKESITEKNQDKILDFLSDSFDFLYFNENEYQCNSSITFRINKNNYNELANLFFRLDMENIKRSSYIKNLIYEYFSLADHKKEHICFIYQCKLIVESIINDKIFNFTYNNKTVSLEYSTIKEHWYLLYFEENNVNVLNAVPIYDIKNILIKHTHSFTFNKKINEKISNIIENESYITGSQSI